MHCCESSPSCIEKAHTKDLKRFKESIHALRVFPQKGIGKTSNEVEARIQEYLGRHLTWEFDALNAFLGIFQAFQELKHPVYNFWGLPISTDPSGQHMSDGLYTSFLSSLALSGDCCDGASAHVLTRRYMFPSWTWAAWKCLPTFSRKDVSETLYAPSVSFRTYQGQSLRLEDFQATLGTSNSTIICEPCIELEGWVTNVRLAQVDSGKNSIPGFQVQWPVPTDRVAVVSDADTAISVERRVLSDMFQVFLLGSGAVYGNDAVAPIDSLRDVRGIILDAGPDDTYIRLGVVTWSRLGKPTFNKRRTVMRTKELCEARRIITPCCCGCKSPDVISFDTFLEDPNHVLEFTKAKIRLV
jgi:hypothetical protein